MVNDAPGEQAAAQEEGDDRLTGQAAKPRVRSVFDAILDEGSFRDPSGQVYHAKGRVFRGIDTRSAANFKELSKQRFFDSFVQDGLVIGTSEKTMLEGPMDSSFGQKSWAMYLEHDVVPFVTYPYEWSFSMLRDAARLHLSLLEDCHENGWTMKDATPYNIQWIGAKPVFIDVPSFEPWEKGEHWGAYRQFCALFLTPLMIKAYLGLDHTRHLRSNLDGISAPEALKMFRGLSRFRRGVLSHIVLPALVERSIAKRERDDAPAKERTATKQSATMILGLLQSLTRLVNNLKSEVRHTDWSKYDKTHSYDDREFQQKLDFVNRSISTKQWNMVWDIGCNTGTFSRACAPYADQVISLDGDHDAVEQLYLAEREKARSNILPLVMDLSNVSPAQGWAGRERKALDQRGKPDLVVCLALIHHIRMSSNIPNALFLDWLRSLDCSVIIEFVDRHDEMVIKLLTNKKEKYEDYSRQQFEQEMGERFVITDSSELKGGKRVIYGLHPK